MQKCEWCGRTYDPRYAKNAFNYKFCSPKCEEEAKRAKFGGYGGGETFNPNDYMQQRRMPATQRAVWRNGGSNSAENAVRT